MEYIIDIILAALLAVCVIAGWKRGFVRSLMDLASNLIAIIVARIVSLRFAPYIFSAYFEQRAHDALKKELASAGGSAASQVQSALDSVPESMNGFLSLIGIDKDAFAASLSEKLGQSGSNVTDVLMTDIVSPIVTAVIRLVLFIAVFALAVLILKLVTLLLDKLTELPALKQANELFGLLFGALKGVIVIAVVCFVLELAAGFIDNESFTSLVADSKLIGIFDNVLKTFKIQN